MLKVTFVKQKQQKTMKIINSAIKKFNSAPIKQKIGLGFVVAVMTFGFAVSPFAFADRFDAQINELRQENNHNQAQLNELEVEAESLEDAINQLNSQINALQRQITQNQAKSDKLKKQIAEAEADLEHQKGVLGQNIKAMYLEGDISTLEILATSKDLSDFVDREHYREIVKDKIKRQVDKINELRLQLKTQREKVDQLIKEDTAIKSQIAAKKSEQNRLLGLNQSEQRQYDKKMKANQKKIDELKRQQAIENARLFGSSGSSVGGGGYPWGSAPCLHGGHIRGYCSGYEWGYNGSWRNYQNNGKGYAYRNCTDYVAWRTGAPAGLGNATTWNVYASSYGYRTGKTPRPGAAAVSHSGYYGHVMYVESVNGDGSIVISDYNRAGTGEYSVSTLSAYTASTLDYVYFR